MKAFGLIIFSTLIVCVSEASKDACGKDSRTLQMYVASPAGGPTDAIARGLADTVGKRGKIILISDNQPAAAGSTAATKAINEKKLIVAPVAVLTVAPHIMGNASKGKALYSHEDFIPLGVLGQNDDILVCNKTKISNATTPEGLLNHLKKSEIVYGSVGKASYPNIIFLEFLKSVKEKNKGDKAVQSVQALEIPYSKVGEAQTGLHTGQVDCFFIPLPLVEPTIAMKANSNLVVIGTSAPKSDIVINGKKVPRLAGTIATEDFGKLQSWVGMHAPKTMPEETRLCVQQEITAALNDPAFQKKFEDLKYRLKKPVVTGAEAEAYLKSDVVRWQQPVQTIRAAIAAESGNPESAKAAQAGK